MNNANGLLNGGLDAITTTYIDSLYFDVRRMQFELAGNKVYLSDLQAYRVKVVAAQSMADLDAIGPMPEQPLFWYDMHPNGMTKMSNDYWFCRQARKAGYDIWCDSTIELGHIGDYNY